MLGGWLVHANLYGLSWRSIFLINVLVGLIAIAAARFIPESRAPQRPSLDWTGVALVSGGLAFFLVPLIEGPVHHWPIWCLWCIAVAPVLLVLFYWQQKHRWVAGQAPLVDIRLLAQRRFALGVLLVALVYSTSSSFFLCFALLAQTGLGLDPCVAGSIFAPCSAGFMLASLSVPASGHPWGTRAIVGGALVYAGSFAVLIAQVQMAGDELVPIRLILVLIVVGAGQGFVMTPLLNLVLGFVKVAQAGMASGVISTVQQIGAALGVAVVGILFRAALAAGDGAAARSGQYASAFVSGVLYNLVAALLVCVLLGMLAKTQRLES